MNKLFLRFFAWLLWRYLNKAVRSVLGHRSLAEANEAMFEIDFELRKENGITEGIPLTWENTSKSDRELYAVYVTHREFGKVGQVLALFRALYLPKIIGKQPIQSQEDNDGG